MHFKNGFIDQNGERYMPEQRVGKLLDDLWGQYTYYTTFNPGLFDKIEGLYRHEELEGMTWETFDGEKDMWGEANGNVWFRQSFSIPEDMAGRAVVYAVATRGWGGWYWGAPQILAWVNGVARTGMDCNHREILLCENAVPGTAYTVELCAFIDQFAFQGKVEMNMAVGALNEKTRRLYYDLKVPFDVSCNLSEDDTRRLDILKYLNHAVSLIDFRLPADKIDPSLDVATAYMEEEFYNKYCGGEPEALITAVGHTHIDTAWLWTMEQTRKKVCRSYTTVLELMDRYPEYTFMAPQAQLYQFLKEELPDAFERVKARVAEGRWEAEGSMWVEPDTNIPSGESLVRQFLYGKRFFEEELGAPETKCMWLPDVFGYSAALPQILKKCGVDYFITSKISWNDYNKLPCDTFRWKGIDGSEVLTHFLCNQDNRHTAPGNFQTNYNGFANADHAIGSWKRYQQKDISRRILFCYGHGDGGGGPELPMLENIRRLDRRIPGCPQMKQGKVQDFLKQLDAEVSGNPKLPVWDGELYFEYHRGCYTSVAKIKKNNRKAEVLLHDAELFSVMAGGEYPKEALDKAWRLLLLNQFHDILPGSSIKEVYDGADRDFETIRALGEEVRDRALDTLAARVTAAQGTTAHAALVVFNPCSFERGGLVEFATDRADFSLDERPVQRTAAGTYLAQIDGVPANGYKVFPFTPSIATGSPVAAGNLFVVAGAHGVETDVLKLTWNKNGHIASLVDKRTGRDFVQNGQAMNRLLALEDRPHTADAWNVDAFMDEKMWALDKLDSMEVVENGFLRCVVRQRRHFMDSTIQQDFIFTRGSERIDVVNTIDWKNNHILLKADFPFNVNAPRATFDIQFGNLERATHENTSWEFAQFEECMHRWVDVSEDGFGLSLLNDCKYGCDAKKGHVRLTLLKSATYPNPEADKEVHTFTYSIFPHENGWKKADTVRQAALLNQPAHTREAAISTVTAAAAPPRSFVCGDKANVIIDTVKAAEDGDGVVVRLYECHNRTTDVTLTFADPLKGAQVCDMREKNGVPVPVDGRTLRLTVKPFEVVTVRVKR
ncbi:MAG: alpha-mannosidase [Oscillospiraceae bacterium]|nr:alpha-mannosidase [Oscillospiraceae bacterium]